MRDREEQQGDRREGKRERENYIGEGGLGETISDLDSSQ